MSSLREQFERHAQAPAGGRRVRHAAKKFDELFRTLRSDIEEYVSSEKTDKKMYIKIASMKTREEEVAMRSLPGYERLHEICADPEVDVYVELKDRSGTLGNGHLYLVITLDAPYHLSPDAPPPENHSKKRHHLHDDRAERLSEGRKQDVFPKPGI
jgi:hypothetical protein